MKKVLAFILVLVICLCGAGCAKDQKGDNSDITETGPQGSIRIYPEFLYSNSWIFSDGTLRENISFTRSGGFAYTDESGASISDFGAYSQYYYLKDDRTIELKGEKTSELVKVLYYDENYLVLNFEKLGTKVFVTEEFTAEKDLPHEKMDVYASQGWVCLTVIGHNDSVIQIAPYNYDKDSYDFFAPYITTFEHKNDISFKFVGSITENGEKITKHYDLDEDKTEYVGEYYTSAYLHFNGKGEIDQGVFYGALEIQEGKQDSETQRNIN